MKIKITLLLLITLRSNLFAQEKESDKVPHSNSLRNMPRCGRNTSHTTHSRTVDSHTVTLNNVL